MIALTGVVGSVLMTENYTLKKNTHQNEVWKLFNSDARKKAIQATQLIYALWRPMQVWGGYDKYIKIARLLMKILLNLELLVICWPQTMGIQ